MSAQRVLLVDDDCAFIRGVKSTLVDEGYEVLTATNGIEGLKVARRYRPNLVILDVNMPYMDGLEMCRRIRQDEDFGDVPVLFLTSRNTVDERVAGLDQGADDYLAKPFNTKELKARVRALLRRAGGPTKATENALNQVTVDSLTLDLQACWVRSDNGDRIQLTPAELELLLYLMLHPDRTFSSEQLLERVWAYEPGTADPSLIRWHIRNLRAKIEPDPSCPTYIRTVSRHGYMLSSS